MAILRGGRRIGNYDIRVGLPRDRSLDNVQGDARLRQRQGNPESTIGRFVANIAQGEGFARPTRYLVRIFIPNKLKIDNIPSPGDTGGEGGSFTAGINSMGGQEIARNVGMMCDSVSMPSRNVASEAHQIYGPKREMPYAYTFPGTIDASFYGDKFLRQRAFFENWQKKIMNINTHNMNYYDEYVGTMDIYQLGSFSAEQDRDRTTYAVRLYEVYPQTIGSIDYSYGSTDQSVNIPITLNFRTWKNLTIDQINGATVGEAFGEVPTIKASKDFGLFGGILNRLPPEIRRAGRDVLQTAKRNLPIGRVTGGKVFPPFL